MDRSHDTITPANIGSWPVTEWKCTMPTWPTLRATKRVTKCGCTAQSALKEGHLSFNLHGRAHTGSLESTMWCTGFSDTLERGWW
jgi:hypothetical protein